METRISNLIVDRYFAKLKNSLNVDVAIVGAGPSGLIAGGLLSQAGFNVALFERKLAPGGGMWGGAMLFNEIVIQEELKPLLNQTGIKTTSESDDLITADSVQSTAALINFCVSSGTAVFNGVSVEDVLLNEKEDVSGVVINWAPVHREGMHVDPLMVSARCLLDATGHPMEIVSTLIRKNEIKLNTPSGKIMGERSLLAKAGEIATVEHTQEVYPGLFVSGMAANGVYGAFRMGPIFGGMLKSGGKAAALITASLQNQN